MQIQFTKNIQFTRLVKADGRLREFNFRKYRGEEGELLFSVDVVDDRDHIVSHDVSVIIDVVIEIFDILAIADRTGAGGVDEIDDTENVVGGNVIIMRDIQRAEHVVKG